MAEIADELLLEVLKACAQSAPEPLYPAAFAAYSGLERNLLDQALDYLRLRGLVSFTDWIQGKGQGYALTSEGDKVLQNPRLLKRAQPITLAPPLAPPREPPDSPWARGEAVRETLLNPVRPVVTTILLAANILMFLVGLAIALRQGAAMGDYIGSGNTKVVAEVRDELGALAPGEVLLRNEWWRLLAYAFVHGGFFHILMNMYALYSLGPLLETLWGSIRFLILYLVGALAGGCAVMLTPQSTVGASGAICGLLASLGVWVYLNRRALPPHIVSSWMRAVFSNAILIVIISTLPGISWACHLGGALGGALVSVPLNFQRFGTHRQRILGLVGIFAVPILALAVVYYEHKDVIQLRREITQVRDHLYPSYRDAEDQAVTVYNEQAWPLLQAWNKNREIDKTRLAAAQEGFISAQKQLLEALQLIDKAGPYQNPGVAETVLKARDYLEEWSKFYVLFSKTIEVPPPWPKAQSEELDQRGNAVTAAGTRLLRAPLPLFRAARPDR
jgi:membrane associated rhomboid family serine protease